MLPEPHTVFTSSSAGLLQPIGTAWINPFPIRQIRSTPSRCSSSSRRSTSRSPTTRKSPRTRSSARSERLQSADPLKLYVRQIGDGRLLTPAEERELARRKDLGDERAKQRLIESQPPARDVDHAQLHEGRRAAPRPDPGGQHGADPRGREVRLQARASSSRRTPPGGSARRSRARSPTRAARSGSPSTSPSRCAAPSARAASWPRS